MKRLNQRLLAGTAVTAALFVPLAIFGGSAFAGSASAEHPSSAQYQYRVTICHLTGSKKNPAHTITVSSAAVAAHLRHGDHLGACTGSEKARKHGKPSAAAPAPAPPNAADTNHGNDKGHGHHK